MATNINYLKSGCFLLLLAIVCALTQTNCNGRFAPCPREEKKDTVDVLVNIPLKQQTYKLKLKDTLWLDINIDASRFKLKSSKFEVKGALGIYDYKTHGYVDDRKFSFIVKEGQILETGDFFIRFLFNQQSKSPLTYNCKIGIVPTKKGIFVANVGNTFGDYTDFRTCPHQFWAEYGFFNFKPNFEEINKLRAKINEPPFDPEIQKKYPVIYYPFEVVD